MGGALFVVTTNWQTLAQSDTVTRRVLYSAPLSVDAPCLACPDAVAVLVLDQARACPNSHTTID